MRSDITSHHHQIDMETQGSEKREREREQGKESAIGMLVIMKKQIPRGNN